MAPQTICFYIVIYMFSKKKNLRYEDLLDNNASMQSMQKYNPNEKIQKKRIVKPIPVNTEINCNISVISALILYCSLFHVELIYTFYVVY